MSELIEVTEKSDAWVKLTLKDEDGETLEVGAINALYWTLYDAESGNVINSRLNILASVTENPHYLRLTPDDNVIVDTVKKKELHKLQLLIGYDSSRGTGQSWRDEIDIHVKNLTLVS